MFSSSLVRVLVVMMILVGATFSHPLTRPSVLSGDPKPLPPYDFVLFGPFSGPSFQNIAESTTPVPSYSTPAIEYSLSTGESLNSKLNKSTLLVAQSKARLDHLLRMLHKEMNFLDNVIGRQSEMVEMRSTTTKKPYSFW